MKDGATSQHFRTTPQFLTSDTILPEEEEIKNMGEESSQKIHLSNEYGTHTCTRAAKHSSSQ